MRGRHERTFAGVLRRMFDFDVFVYVRCGGRQRALKRIGRTFSHDIYVDAHRIVSQRNYDCFEPF